MVNIYGDFDWRLKCGKTGMTTRYILAAVTATALMGASRMPDARLRHAQIALTETLHSPDRGIPRDLIDKAQCVVIVPDLLKAAFLVGGQYGRGYAMCRHEHGWSSPAAVRIEGGSFGFQLGGSSTDVIMLVMNRHGMERLLGNKFTIGGDAAAAAGPVGRATSAQTDLAMRAEILSWSRSRGLFAGISLQGATLRPDRSENRRLYGRPIGNREILETGVPVPGVAQSLVAELDRVSGVARAQATEPLRAPGGRVILGENEVHFATGQYAVPLEASAALAHVAQTLKDNPSWRVRIEGFTDNVGNREANLELSEHRAHAVMDWLADQGVNRAQMTTRGYGESRPIASNATENGRAQNRRVEVVRAGTPQAPTGF
jgi:lipid-binding SYLF domain-containing protein